MVTQNRSAMVAVVGAGPAGLFAARELAQQGIDVALFNRNIKPGGLAEYGIYPDKLRLKDGLRAQFDQILDCNHIHYYGNVAIGGKFPLSLNDLQQMGFNAVLVASGAQGTKWLGLPGEDLCGVYHAKTLVFYYNHMPPFASMPIKLGKKMLVVGVGNVMTDIVRFLITRPEVEEITTIARRGPAEVKFDRRELEPVAIALDGHDFDKEISRVSPAMQAVAQDPRGSVAEIHETLAAVTEHISRPVWKMRFLYSPLRMLGNDDQNLSAVEFEENNLELLNGTTRAVGTGQKIVMDADGIVFAIGDRVDDQLGLPVQGNEFVKSSEPRYPINGISYEAAGQDLSKPGAIFLAGWSRQASTGMVGIARKDGAAAANAVLQYLADVSIPTALNFDLLETKLRSFGYRYINAEDLQKLKSAEKEIAQTRGLPEFKFDTDEEMLKAMGL